MSEDRDWEADAAQGGWVAEPEGIPEDKRLDAKTFVERGEKIAGVMKSKVEKLERQVEELSQGNVEFRKYHQETLERTRRESQARITQLEKDRAEAITEGDGTRFTKVDNELAELKSQPSGKAEFDQMANDWVNENQWYINNSKLAAYADGLASRLQNTGYKGKAYFNELTRDVKETFPEEFKNPNRSKAASVESETEREQVDPKPRSFNALPKEAKDQCDRFVKSIKGFTREQFIAEYDWD